ncbi:hypothetical protein [Blastomonas aquatica]|uniref:Uncharacterized protein n=1 Tax=Blastomonas aquatica TaxID=1510276 RepID=A0ABQ1JA72_9SPHN|nr:hypothetical protein [Blastomonas aquatica]GGB63918.1 hypothetical protein GCM10010833_18650 [Blastomonas aquatica]
MDSLFGKPSTIILLGCKSHGNINEVIRGRLKQGAQKNFEKGRKIRGALRFLIHLPAVPTYIVVWVSNWFGFFKTRIPEYLLDAADLKLTTKFPDAKSISQDTQWFKALESVVINKNPTATARMYNYLVISGLFRSICTIFLGALWIELLMHICRVLGHTPPDSLIVIGDNSTLTKLISYLAISVVYLFSLFSYLKFQRRYAEEAIFAYVNLEN